MKSMKFNVRFTILFALSLLILVACKREDPEVQEEETVSLGDDFGIMGYHLLEQISGHWVGSNQTAFGYVPRFIFDFRPISSSHVHSIFESATNQNIFTSLFIAEYNGEKRIFARNGGQLGLFRATYFVVDLVEETELSNYYRLVDVTGGSQRCYMEFTFSSGNFNFKAYKDNSGTLVDPIIHMNFNGSNANPDFDDMATNLFNFPQPESEKDLTGAFNTLVDPGSALFTSEATDPFPRVEHGYLSEFTVNFNKLVSIETTDMIFLLSKEPIVSNTGIVHAANLYDQLTRTILIDGSELSYTATYVHPDTYYLTAFTDLDGNFYPSFGDVSSESILINVPLESFPTANLAVNIVIPF